MWLGKMFSRAMARLVIIGRKRLLSLCSARKWTSTLACSYLPLSHHRCRHHHHQHQIPQETMQPSSSSSSAVAIGNFFRRKDGGGAYDLGELDQALFLYLDGNDPSSSSSSVHQDQKQIQSGMRPPTLNIFPSQPMRVNPSTKVSSGGLVSAGASCSKRPSETTTSMELANQRTNNNKNKNKNKNNNVASAPLPPAEPAKTLKRGGNRKGYNNMTSEHDGHKNPDPKTLRRLAQNREAARKSRLRKKAYIQQLESSRIKLMQLEQELHRARSQGILLGGGPVVANEQGRSVNISHISTDAAIFDMEYARWLEEHHHLMCELRAAIQEHLPENDLQLFVENGLAHYDEMMNLKEMVMKSDVFHLATGMWMTPTERCFMWMGGFRPSELIKVILNHVKPLTEQQILGICGLQQSTQEAEEALSLGLEALNQSLSDTISSDFLSYPTNMANYMGQMTAALDKLSTLEGFIRQADGLRHQMIHRLHQILTTHQFARCLLAITEYFHRLRALSSLWLSRPRQE